jgi:hypothetical protein
MGMVLQLTTVSDATIERVLADPPLVWQLVAPDEPELYDNARREDSPQPSFLGRLLGTKNPPPARPPGLTLSPAEGKSTDLDKAWHGLHYLLTGTAWAGDPPLNFLAAGGREVGDLEVGYGPARVFTAAETRAVRDALERVTADDLRGRFDADAMTAAEIYPEVIWKRVPPEDDPLGYLLEYYGTLRSFAEEAVAARVGLVVALM